MIGLVVFLILLATNVISIPSAQESDQQGCEYGPVWDNAGLCAQTPADAMPPILNPYIYCHGGYDGPFLHDWGLICVSELENLNGVMSSSSEWLSPEAVNDALNSAPTSTVCKSFLVDGICYESRSRATISVLRYTTGTINMYPNSLYKVEIYSNPQPTSTP